MAPRAQPDCRLLGTPLALIGLSLSLTPAAAAANCDCVLGLSREALIALIVVLAGVSASCFCALVIVAVGVMRSKGWVHPGRRRPLPARPGPQGRLAGLTVLPCRLVGRFGVQQDRMDLRAVHVESRLMDPQLEGCVMPALETQGLVTIDSMTASVTVEDRPASPPPSEQGRAGRD
ncbi:Transmembrane protein 210 [Galemys pyrenaicus]|uniref:Transmembrane protein 210 n=1 Tax=Galemys pyrenaicus TaxID=202257 RepID=A0A8J6DS25_GALPY|nr:Transmembrane protein 210 [Galemys pyrenaicus]